MINVKKGPAHSLGQADVRGTRIADVVAGMVCYVNTSGVIVKGYMASGATGIPGFAINNSADGDSIESDKIALYTLDGTSVIETDQSAVDITATNYPIGAAVYALPSTDGTNPGKVTNTLASGTVIGYVEGIRNLQADLGVSTTQNYVNTAGATVSNTAKIQKNIPVLSIKLMATAAANG